MRVYIVRHGETMWNREKRLQGSTDVELNEKGVALARITGKALEKVPFRRAFASPLSRARVTAQLILEGRKLPLTLDERLQEISFGGWEGLCIDPEQHQIPEGFKRFFLDPEAYEPDEEGESVLEFCRRTEGFVKELLASEGAEDEAVLVVVHGAVTRALMQNFLGGPLKDFWRGNVPPNCAVNIIDITDGKATLVEKDVTYGQ